ncbi:MAG: hypothetical protein K5643_05500 [Saccharofermentans sp.]|nr:hypothetical protein [Saccharofermentans sp.]
MKVLCDYCGKPIDETLASCPECGAVNKHMLRSGNQVPKTIEELQAFVEEHNIPVDRMRFFIGIDYQEPRAFGIFKRPDNQNCIVYKNKSDGTRIIRYEGADEAYAVNEIYQKMKAEYLEHRQMLDRRSFFDGGDYGKGHPERPFTDYRKPAPPPPKEKFKYSRGNNILGNNDGSALASAILALLFLAVVIASSFTACDATLAREFFDELGSIEVDSDSDRPEDGYYEYGDEYYYYDDDRWYGIDDDGYWAETEVPDDLDDNYDDYFEDDDYDDLDDDAYDYVPYFGSYDYDYDYGYDYDYDDSWADDSWDDDDWDYYYYDSGDDSDYDYDYDYDSDYDSDYDGGWGGVISGGGGWDSDW